MHVLTYLVPTGVLLAVGIPLARDLAAHGVAPLAFAFWPTFAASLALGALAMRSGHAVFRKDVARFSVLAGLGGYALPMSATFSLSATAGAAFASLAFTMPPLFTLAFNIALGRERPRAWRVAAIALGFAGALLLATRGLDATEPGPRELFLVFLVPALIGATNVYRSIHMPPGVSAAWLGAGLLAAASAAVFAAAIAQDAWAVPLNARVMGGLAAQGAGLVAGYLLYFELQKRADPVTFSFLGYVTMLTAAAAGVLWLGDALTWTAVPAELLVLAALWMISR